MHHNILRSQSSTSASENYSQKVAITYLPRSAPLIDFSYQIWLWVTTHRLWQIWDNLFKGSIFTKQSWTRIVLIHGLDWIGVGLIAEKLEWIGLIELDWLNHWNPKMRTQSWLNKLIAIYVCSLCIRVSDLQLSLPIIRILLLFYDNAVIQKSYRKLKKKHFCKHFFHW